jgi:hypothetical protein
MARSATRWSRQAPVNSNNCHGTAARPEASGNDETDSRAAMLLGNFFVSEIETEHLWLVVRTEIVGLANDFLQQVRHVC